VRTPVGTDSGLGEICAQPYPGAGSPGTIFAGCRPGRTPTGVHRRAQQRGGFTLVSLGRPPAPGRGTAPDAWREWLAEDNRVSPSDEAAFRIDFANWLARLPVRKRRVAELLAAGETTGEVARRVGVTSGAVSQARSWLAADWHAFQGGATCNSELKLDAHLLQARAIRTIADRQGADLEGLLREDYEVDRPEDLSIKQASEFIERLKAAASV
jgi:hypothetical protein